MGEADKAGRGRAVRDETGESTLNEVSVLAGGVRGAVLRVEQVLV